MTIDLGAVVGTDEFKDEFVSEKIDTWIEELAELGEIAKVESHVAYCAYVFGLQHRYTWYSEQYRALRNI